MAQRLTRAQKMIQFCGAMAGMTETVVQEVLDELVEEVRTRGSLPKLNAISYRSNKTWAPRFRVFRRLLREDILNSDNRALKI